MYAVYLLDFFPYTELWNQLENWVAKIATSDYTL